MKKPAPLTFLLGTRRVCAVASVSAVLMVYGWYTGQLSMPWFLPLIAVSLAFKSFKAKREVAIFNQWQSQWNAMAGVAEPVKTSWRQRPWAITIWFCLALLAVTQPFHDAAINSACGVALVPVSGWLIVKFFRQLTRRLSTSRGKAAVSKQHVARICLPVPRHCATVREATAALPGYCQALLKRQP